MNFNQTHPCKDCPYRKDAPLKHWHKDHFKEVLEGIQSEKQGGLCGKAFGCHKNDGEVCRGFLMDQLKNNLPSIKLRLAISRGNVKSGYLDSVCSKVEMYKSAIDMVKANFPELLKKKRNATK